MKDTMSGAIETPDEIPENEIPTILARGACYFQRRTVEKYGLELITQIAGDSDIVIVDLE